MTDESAHMETAREKLERIKSLVTKPVPALKKPEAPAPRVEFMADSRSENDQLIDQAINSIDVIEAYNMWAGKGVADARGRTESIKVRCPNPNHPDNDPSAWINTEKGEGGVWTCRICKGGDKYDIAAWHFGLPVPGYKDGKNFHELRRKMAESKGYTFAPSVTGKYTVMPPEVMVQAPPTAPTGPVLVVSPHPDGKVPDEPLATVTPIAPEPDEPDIDVSLDWRKIVPRGTFLDTWMNQTTVDDLPEEFHFWNGMLAIASACGRDATLYDFKSVYANLFICVLGTTGAGKSRAKSSLDELLRVALPYQATDPFSKGIMQINAPASGEALIWTFEKKMEDPTKPKAVDRYPVKGLVDFNELSALMGRASRMGNVLIPNLMELYDMLPTVGTVSRTSGHVEAFEPFACAITTSQPRSLRSLLTQADVDSGFLNRWMFIAGKSKRPTAIGGVKVDITPAVKPLQKILGWAGTVGELNWSQPAHDLFSNFFHTEIHPTREHDQSGLLKRLDLLCKKLVLIMTANMRHSEVQIEAVQQMIQLYPYILKCYGIPGIQVGRSIQQELRDEILRTVVRLQEKTKKGASHRDIKQRVRVEKYPDNSYTQAMKFMLETDELVEIPRTPGPGRPTVRFGVPDLVEAKEFLKMRAEAYHAMASEKEAK